MATPIIVPVTHTRTRDCIVVEGRKYCEDSDISGSTVAAVVIGFLIFSALMYFVGKKFRYHRWFGDTAETAEIIGGFLAGVTAGLTVLVGIIYGVWTVLS